MALRDVNTDAALGEVTSSDSEGRSAPKATDNTDFIKRISNYISHRRAGPVTAEAIHQKNPDIPLAVIRGALTEAHRRGVLISNNFLPSIIRCNTKLETLRMAPEDLFDETKKQRRAEQINDLEIQIAHLQRQMGQLRRRPSLPSRPLTLIEHIASSGGIRVPSRAKARKITKDNPRQQVLFGEMAMSRESASRDCDASDVLNVIDGGPVLISMFGALVGTNARLSFGQAAEAALEAGYYMPDQHGSGVDHTAFADLLRTDYDAWLRRDWQARVFSYRNASDAAYFLDSLQLTRSTEEAISRFGYPVAGEDCIHWRRHIRFLYNKMEQQGISHEHLLYTAYRLNLDPEVSARMTTRELVAEIRYGLDMMDEDRSVRMMTTQWVMESAFPGKARKYQRLLAAEDAAKAKEAAAASDIPFDSDPAPVRQRRKKRGAGAQAIIDDCPF